MIQFRSMKRSAALGEVPLEPLAEAGLIGRLDSGRYVSPFKLNVV